MGLLGGREMRTGFVILVIPALKPRHASTRRYRPASEAWSGGWCRGGHAAGHHDSRGGFSLPAPWGGRGPSTRPGVTDLPRLLFFQPNSGELDPLYVVEVLLRCSRESLENSATEAAKPAKPDERGEMQVRSVSLFVLRGHRGALPAGPGGVSAAA